MNMPGARRFEDEELLTLCFTDYYMDYEPESCLVAEVDGRVVSYLLACKDTKRFTRIMALKTLPKLIVRVSWKMITRQYVQKETYRLVRWALLRSWRELPQPPLGRYPAHVHWNIDPEIVESRMGLVSMGIRIGLELAKAMKDHFSNAGVRGAHGVIVEPEGNETLSRFACRFLGGKVAAVKKLSLEGGLDSRRLYAKLLLFEW